MSKIHKLICPIVYNDNYLRVHKYINFYYYRCNKKFNNNMFHFMSLGIYILK